MKIIIRVDASRTLGTGHVMRCLVLAESFRERGADVEFICASLIGNLCGQIEKRGFKTYRINISEKYDVLAKNHKELSADWISDAEQSCKIIQKSEVKPDWLIIDHYGLGLDWEQTLRPKVKRILVIDDLANRQHDCDILVDQNLHANPDKRYDGLVPESTKIFIGPQFAQINTKFDEPALLRRRDGKLRQLLVYFGGADPGNQIIKTLDALRLLKKMSFSTTILLGPIHPDPCSIKDAAYEIENINILDTTENMALLISEADLAIGTCGIAAWERCLLGLPSIVVITAENQREDAEILDKIGAIKNLGDAASVRAIDFAKALKVLSSHPEILIKMGQASFSVMSDRKSALLKLNESIYGKS